MFFARLISVSWKDSMCQKMKISSSVSFALLPLLLLTCVSKTMQDSRKQFKYLVTASEVIRPNTVYKVRN